MIPTQTSCTKLFSENPSNVPYMFSIKFGKSPKKQGSIWWPLEESFPVCFGGFASQQKGGQFLALPVGNEGSNQPLLAGKNGDEMKIPSFPTTKGQLVIGCKTLLNKRYPLSTLLYQMVTVDCS